MSPDEEYAVVSFHAQIRCPAKGRKAEPQAAAGISKTRAEACQKVPIPVNLVYCN